jgi:hypothetical protein
MALRNEHARWVKNGTVSGIRFVAIHLDVLVLSVCCCLLCAVQALLLHNSVIKHAVYQNVGWVVEQEGDSFSVVFHEAEDAVAFTLQVRSTAL